MQVTRRRMCHIVVAGLPGRGHDRVEQRCLGGELLEKGRLRLLFISSAEASFATGSEFVVDGGLLLGPALSYEAA
nr:hypothetical protein [Parafrankia elaeagni]